MPEGLKLNEHYTSVQGEGPHVGVLTQFVRFSGCNMRCPGWPCDTPHAIYPNLYKNDPRVDAEVLAAQIVQARADTGASHVCLTGGEPYMQPNDDLHHLIWLLSRESFTFDMFTNGSFVYKDYLMRFWNLTLVMDWKLPGSGEAETKIDERMTNARQLRDHDAIKFIVTGQEDLMAALQWSDYLKSASRATQYVGAAWGKITDDEIVQFMKDHQVKWRLNVQMHKHIWGEARGV